MLAERVERAAGRGGGAEEEGPVDPVDDEVSRSGKVRQSPFGRRLKSSATSAAEWP